MPSNNSHHCDRGRVRKIASDLSRKASRVAGYHVLAEYRGQAPAIAQFIIDGELDGCERDESIIGCPVDAIKGFFVVQQLFLAPAIPESCAPKAVDHGHEVRNAVAYRCIHDLPPARLLRFVQRPHYPGVRP